MLKPLLAFAALSHFASATFAGACAPPSITATVLTPNGTTIDQDGGVVVGLSQGFGGGGKDVGDLTKLDWKFVQAGKASRPKVQVIAPGLAVFVPDKPAGKLELRDDKTAKVTVVFKFAARREMPIEVAPDVNGIKFSNTPSPRNNSSSTDATLAAGPPANTVAVLVYDPAELKAGKPARSWTAIADAKAKTVQLSYSGRCQTILPGTRPASQGDKVVLVWLDAQGHQSAPSKEIEVK